MESEQKKYMDAILANMKLFDARIGALEQRLACAIQWKMGPQVHPEQPVDSSSRTVTYRTYSEEWAKIRELHEWVVEGTNACGGIIAGAAVDDKMIGLWPWLANTEGEL